MTTYSDDFSGETVSSPPSNWTARYTTTNQTFDIVNPTDGEAEDDRAARFDHTATAIRLFSFDSMDADTNRQDSEIVIRFRFTATQPNDQALMLWLRASGGAGTEDGYVVELDNLGNFAWRWQLYRYDAGTKSSQIGSNSDYRSSVNDGDPQQDEWYYARFRVNSTSLQFRQWLDGQPEPTDWDIDQTDSDLNVDGWTGFGCNTNSEEVEVDYVGTGTNGDTAPINASTNTVLRTSAAYAAAVISETNPSVRVSAVYASVVVKVENPTVVNPVVIINP